MDAESVGHSGCLKFRAFTLIELLVVIGVITMLISLILPALGKARKSAQLAQCKSNLHQVGVGLHQYANDNDACIPQGPEDPVLPYYPFKYMPTSQIQTFTKMGYVSVGYGMIMAEYLPDGRVFFCPADDDQIDVEEELAKINSDENVFSSYFYRHRGLSDKNKIDDLGIHFDGIPARALVMDRNYIDSINHIDKANHAAELVNILYSDGHVSHQSNHDQKYTVQAFDVEAVFAVADAAVE